MSSPFHAGEQALQAQAGRRERLEEIGQRVIRDHLPEQHRELFEKLPYLVVGSLDAAERPWASLLVGPPGFVRAPDARTLAVAAAPLPGDPLAGNLRPGTPLGLLGIELATRRRNRANGRVIAVESKGFALRVLESFGNCPQYIQARAHRFVETTPPSPEPEGPLLSARAADLIRRADTCFLATAAAGGVDVSHRGGRPGFIAMENDGGASLLTLPDYRGNFFFNTLGNVLLNPRAGLLVPDFDSGSLLTLTAEASVDLEQPQRPLSLRPTHGFWLEGVLPLRWSAPDFAPQLT